MNYREELHWILDKPGTTFKKQEEYQENIDFVHSLNLKCDCVGWCTLDLSDSRTEDIFHQIATFCKQNDWKARCIYTRKYINIKSDWYKLVPHLFTKNTHFGKIETVTTNSEKIYTHIIRAYHEIQPCLKIWQTDLYVPERFRNFCIKNNPNDLDFCWAKDIGKYKAEQYFHVYGKKLIPEIAVDFSLQKANAQVIAAVGGWLPKIVNTFHTIQQIILPDCFLSKDMPDRGIGYAYIPSTFSCAGRNMLLIHKDVAHKLLQQRIISDNSLQPVPIVDNLPCGYILQQTQEIARPTETFMDKLLSEYEELKHLERPTRIISEQESIKYLKIIKKEQPANFEKAMPKIKRQQLLGTAYASLIPYYQVTSGGYLSDEYELLPYPRAVIASSDFHQRLVAEELLADSPDGIVIAICPDGDSILLCKDGRVIRFSHESPEIINCWPCLAHFIVDALNV